MPEITNTLDLDVSLQCGSFDDPQYNVIISNPNWFPVKYTWRDLISGTSGGGIVNPPSVVVPVNNAGNLVFSLTWEKVEDGSFETKVFPFAGIVSCVLDALGSPITGGISIGAAA